MKCSASVMLYPKGNATIEFETHATTREGVLKATGRELWHQLGHSPISVWGIECGREDENPMSGKYVTYHYMSNDHRVVFDEYHKAAEGCEVA